MLRQVVQSSSLQSIGYDRAQQILEVEFHGGKIYRYLGVSSDVWSALRQAPSKGQFFQNFIRDRFETTRVA